MIPAMGFKGLLVREGPEMTVSMPGTLKQILYLPPLVQKLISHHSLTCSLCSSHTGLLSVPAKCQECFHLRAFLFPFLLPDNLPQMPLTSPEPQIKCPLLRQASQPPV